MTGVQTCALPISGGKPASKYQSAANIVSSQSDSERGAVEAKDDESSISLAAREAELKLDLFSARPQYR